MNKILNFNIGNQMFPIEENAYKSLHSYVKSLKTYFKNDKDSDEIIGDLEGRMAEIFTESTSKKKPFVTAQDVEDLMVKLGRTEDFEAAQNIGEVTEGTDLKSVAVAKGKKLLQKKLMRDPNDRIIGGVCSGLGNYFGVSPIIMRLAVLALFLGAGFGLLIYIILWIVMPLAKSSTDIKLMKGLTIDDESVIGNMKANAEPIVPTTVNSETGERKLLRNLDGKIIAGVSTGLASYFNIDKVFVRLGFVGLTVFNGVGILLYIVLWIIMPTINQQGRLPLYNING